MGTKFGELKYPQSIYGILAILSTGPQSGYDIRKALDDPEMFYWRESFGNIYPMLKKLYNDGLVDKKESYVKTKKRLIYQLNRNGWTELQNWLHEPANLNRFRIEILMKLRFGASSGIEVMMEQLANYRKTSTEQLVEAEQLLEHISQLEETLSNDLRKITIGLFAERKRATLAWCDESVKILGKWKTVENEPISTPENELTPQWINNETLSPESERVVSIPARIIPLME